MGMSVLDYSTRGFQAGESDGVSELFALAWSGVVPREQESFTGDERQSREAAQTWVLRRRLLNEVKNEVQVDCSPLLCVAVSGSCDPWNR